MENNRGPGRPKNVTGSAKVEKKERVETNGPVGRKDGYSGRQRPSGGSPKPLGSSGGQSGERQAPTARGILLGNSKGGSMGRILGLVAVVIIVIMLIKCVGGGQSCSLGQLANIAGGGGGGDLLGIAQGYDEYSEDDMSAPAAESASTSGGSADLTVASSARAKYTDTSSAKNVTLMVYMCGTDLESKYGMATNDLNEMLHAELDDSKVNIIVETGGTKTWKNNVISSSTNQLWRVTSRGMQALNNNLGKKSMTDPNTLSEFIKYCKANYPADRYMLIFWDHGGGALSGYGYDQYYSGSMTLDKINKALKDGGVKYDFIGFDACLMATMETALVTQQYADYLIGSEETEPGVGWYYTNWLTMLSKDPSINTVTLGKRIVDDFNDVCKKNRAGDATTLSVVDLAEFSGTVPAAFRAFSQKVGDMLDGDGYQTVANARNGAREFGESAGINHVDLVHLALRTNTSEGQRLADALNGCIKYNRTSVSMKNSYGLSIYFPLTSFKSVSSAVSLYNSIGMDKSYTEAVKSFASLAAGGQIAAGHTNQQSSSAMGSLLGSLTGTSSGTSSSDVLGSLLGGLMGGGSGSSDVLGGLLGGDYSGWFDSGRVMDNCDYYDAHTIYVDDLALTEKNGKSYLSLSADKWAIVQNVQINAFLDDGEGYLDLGMDLAQNYLSSSWEIGQDLPFEYDRTWLAINGHPVAYYFMDHTEDNGHHVVTGRVPARLNGEIVYLIVTEEYDGDYQNDVFTVVGARIRYENGETDTVARGLIRINNGDKLEFLCDYYGYDQSYNDTYVIGDAVTVNGALTVSFVEIEDDPVVITYCLTDIYDTEFWTESKIY